MKKLFIKFKEARSEGLKVSFSWPYIKANVINKELSQNSKRLSKTVVVMFFRKFNIKLRRVQRKKQINKSKFGPEMMKRHCTLREGVIKSCSHLPDLKPKWGRFPPSKRVNVDQIPLPFAINRTITYEEEIPKELRKYHKVWAANGGAGLEKRQCSVQLVFSLDDDNLRVAVIF